MGLRWCSWGPQKGHWALSTTVAGRRRDIGIGALSLASLKEAREIALEMRRGIDPVAERQKRVIKVLTFAEAVHAVPAEQRAGWKNGKHQDQRITTLELYAFPMLGKCLVNDIEGPLIREALLGIWLTKPETARRVKQRIGVILDWSRANGRPVARPA